MDTDCEKAYDIIKEFLHTSSSNRFRSRHRNVDDFFTQIEFNKYLSQFTERFNSVEYLLTYAKENRSNELSAHILIVQKMLKHNTRCLDFAKKVERFSDQEYKKFNNLSQRYTSDTTDKYGDNTSVRSSVKGFLGIGTKSKYERMTNDIPPCLYVAMSKFANGIVVYEEQQLKPLGEHPPKDVTLEYIEECLEKISIHNLEQILEKILEELKQQGNEEPRYVDASQYVDAPTLLSTHAGGHRRHRRHTHRRHHSKHSHKSVKRSKKGKKIMKSHTRKRHTRARKQIKRRNRSRK
jgi:hypothetical protein